MIDLKNIHEKKNILGQFFTPQERCRKIVDRIDFTNSIVVEPSFGNGNFINELSKHNFYVIGIELDRSVYDDDTLCLNRSNVKLMNKNFYDFTLDDIESPITSNRKLIFVGNPPYRTPAYSLSTHKTFIDNLRKKYKLPGIREEAIFFILHTIDLILASPLGEGEIHYVLPKSILTNNSKYYTNFKKFLKKTCLITNVMSISGNEFENVSQDLVCLSLSIQKNLEVIQESIQVDDKTVSIDTYLCLEDESIIPFQRIFKKTYLGSVPCESILMSVSGESKEHFKKRLVDIISDDSLTKERLYELLQYNGKFHLSVFNKKPFTDEMVQKKLGVLLTYVESMKEKENIIDEFKSLQNYKEINGRNDVRYYFRCKKFTTKCNFVYQLNPNPCKSFYFPGNPSGNSGDYFGYCDYDVNRNVSPGANRTVPVNEVETNLTDEFKVWWTSNTDEPLSEIFDYILFISKSKWYKNMKNTNKRFYFCIPSKFVPKEKRVFDFDF